VIPTDGLGKLLRRGSSIPARWHQSYRRWRYVRLLPGTRLLREFERVYPEAFFIQIGSNDGKQHDPLRRAILRRRWRGIMVEPVPYVFERLQRNQGRFHDRITLENVAIGDRDGNLPFYHLPPVNDHETQGLPAWYDAIGSFKREHLLKHAAYIPDIDQRLVCTEVPTLTFESLCKKHQVDDVDLIQIDVEGYDFEVIRSIDLNQYRARLLVYEHYHLTPDEQARCRQHLQAQGYDTLEDGMDTWCLALDNLTTRDHRLIELWNAVSGERLGPPRVPLSLAPIGETRRRLRRLAGKCWRGVKQVVEGRRRAEIDHWAGITAEQTTQREWARLTKGYDDTTPLPSDAADQLSDDSPRLRALREAYTNLRLPVTVPSVWNGRLLGDQLRLPYFRGESPYAWNYREWPRSMSLKYFIFSQYVRNRDTAELLERLGEDGAFGCWTFEYPGYPTVSRDLLDSVNEILFLDRHLGVLHRSGLRVLDIGAGYGRTAHRMTQAATGIEDYCCVDAIPESTFLSEYYLGFRRCMPPARVVPLNELGGAVQPCNFDLAINVHSFSECTYDAVAWWIEWLERLRVPNLMVVPNDPDELLAFEGDGSRRDFRPLIAAAGYELSVCEPVFDDPAVRDLVRVPDQFFLFHRAV
jgi:FkbM family methyltransferase